MDTYRFEKVAEKDLASVTEIYNYYVINTTATFSEKPFSCSEMRELVFFDNPRYSAFVILEGENLCGYCILTQFNKREAYDHTAEITIYLKPEYTGKGIGTVAVQFIENVAKGRGIHVLIAIICGENTASIKLFEKNGYEKCAHYKEVGKKFGRFLDVVSYQKII